MPGSVQNKPTTETCLIHDTSDSRISKMSRSLDDLTEIYMIHVEIVGLDAWRTVFDGRSKIVFIVSLDTEIFHREIKRTIIENGDKDILLILVHDDDMEQLTDRTIKQIRKERRRMTSGMRDESRKRAITTPGSNDNLTISKVKSGDISKDLWNWFPLLLRLLSNGQPIKRNRRKEVGVFYKINADNEIEFDWFINQKKVLEEVFGVTCEHSDPHDCDDVEFVNNAECVVIYVNKTTLQTLNTLHDEQKSIIALVREVLCKQIVFIEKIHDSFDKVMCNHFKMSRMGHGSMVYCIELLSTLGIVNIRRRPDLVFYSNRHIDDNYIEFYQQLERAQTIYSRIDYTDDTHTADEAEVNLVDSLHRAPSSLMLPDPTRSKNIEKAVYAPSEQYSYHLDQKTEYDGEQIEHISCLTCLKRMFPARL